MIPYKIEGNKCGRDESGEFHCKCGKCLPLYIDGKQVAKAVWNGISSFPFLQKAIYGTGQEFQEQS